jgi:hypothetical protein
VALCDRPAEADVRLCAHPVLRRFMLVVRVVVLSWRSAMVWGYGRAGVDTEMTRSDRERNLAQPSSLISEFRGS